MAADGAAEPQERPGLVREALWHLANLAVLWTFAVAQPLFDLLGDNPEFFERTLKDAFEVERSERLESGTRVLYYARPK